MTDILEWEGLSAMMAAETFELDVARFRKAMKESPTSRWLVHRLSGLWEVLQDVGEPTLGDAIAAFRAAAEEGTWAGLYEAESVLANVLWGGLDPPELPEGETYDLEQAGPEGRWLNSRMQAALSTFDRRDSDASDALRLAALDVAVTIHEAAGDRGPWPVLFRVEQLADLVAAAERSVLHTARAARER